MSGIDAANLALLVDLANRIGKSGDAAGVASLYAHLARIYAAVDQVEGFTDTLETVAGLIKVKTDLIGTAADAPSTSTLFGNTTRTAIHAANAESYAYQAMSHAVDGNIKIGVPSDAASTATIFGKLARIASASVFDKTKYTQVSNYTRQVFPAGTTTVFSVNGKGYLEAAAARAGYNLKMRITVDGVVVYFGGSVSNSSAGVAQHSDGLISGGSYYYLIASLGDAPVHPTIIKPYPYTLGDIAFCELNAPIVINSSLKIEILSDYGSGDAAPWCMRGGVL